MMLKEGAIVDPGHRERLAGLLRFALVAVRGSEATCSLDDYMGRMPEDQKRIYYLGGPDLAAIKKSPNLEIFRRRGLEVLVPHRADRRVRDELRSGRTGASR